MTLRDYSPTNGKAEEESEVFRIARPGKPATTCKKHATIASHSFQRWCYLGTAIETNNEKGTWTKQTMSCAATADLLPWTATIAFFAITKGALVTMDASSKPSSAKGNLAIGFHASSAALAWRALAAWGKEAVKRQSPETMLVVVWDHTTICRQREVIVEKGSNSKKQGRLDVASSQNSPISLKQAMRAGD
ncbi:hypothetical protein PG996_002155 [Apiospora saccharicola]|uniref:Uncharacterized protein n=1 Tax=Apiospora saccharicola TaxID=335842 RepID=A0ABR1WMM7_9PEZI